MAQEPAQEPREQLRCLIILYGTIGNTDSIVADELALRAKALLSHTLGDDIDSITTDDLAKRIKALLNQPSGEDA
ncbi:MAG: hypothetical protein U0L98_03540 [Clostridia bacterium]|nr:hypothetical protein [Clostridia bacterium]